MKEFIETSQDVIDLFNKAKEDGHEWAQSSIEQFNENFFIRQRIVCHELQYHPRNAVLYGLNWPSTKEGSDYWDAIHTKLCH